MRIFSLVLVVLALMMLGADAVTSLEHQGQISVRSFEAIWALFDADSVKAFKVWADHAMPGFIDPLGQSFVIVSIGLAGCVSAVALTVVVYAYRHYATLDARMLKRLKG